MSFFLNTPEPPKPELFLPPPDVTQEDDEMAKLLRNQVDTIRTGPLGILNPAGLNDRQNLLR